MAKQKGIVPLEGTIGNVTFYKSKAGYLAREKGGVDGSRIATDPAFARTRENGSEFGRAGKAGRLLRTSLRALLLSINDSYMTGRLTREFVKVIRADEISPRGQRNVIDGEAELLQGFEFNQNGRLGATLYAPFTTSINRATGELSVVMPSFVPMNMIAAPAGATHYKINAAGVEIDFEAETFVVDLGSTGEAAIGTNPAPMTTLTATVTPASTKPLFLAVGIEFFQQVNGATYPLRNGAYNALSLVLVSSGV